MDEAEIIRHKLDMINRNSVYGLYPAYSSEIAKIVHSYLERGITCEYDIMNCPEPPIYIGPVKVKTLKERLEEIKMKTTSTQSIKNVKDISVTVENYPMEEKSILTVVATTDDDIFEFVFEGPDILQSCKKSGLFTGWEKDQEIREKNKEINELKQKLLQVENDKKRLTYRYETLEKQFTLEKGANEAQHKFIREYAGKGTEVQFNYAIDDAKEVSYVIVDKDEYNKNFEKWLNAQVEQDSHKNTRADILDQAKKCVCGQREQDYGTPESNFQLIADLWNGYLGFTDPGDKVKPTDVSMMMALMKIARIRNGGGSGDSFVDLAGYAACGGEIWYGRKTQVPKGE